MPPSKTQEPSKDGHRIAKLLARAGIASRREIERMIEEGRVALNGKTIDTPATILTTLEGVTVDGNPVEAPEAARLFRYHKPAGLLTTERDPMDRPTIYDRLPRGLPRVMPVGRLDLATEGLLLLTNDGGLKRELELPASGVERSYRARAYGHVTQEQLEDLMLGVEIEGIRYGSINANIERRTGANLWIEMTLTEGKNREVRRVLEYLGLQVNRLIRTRYGPFWLGDLPPGDVDEIRASDVNTFRTVLSKPGGGKAASNLQFAVRARVPERPAAPVPEPVRPGKPAGLRREPDRSLRANGPSARPGLSRVQGRTPEPVSEMRFTPRVTPARAERPARDDAAPRERGRPYESAGARFAPRAAPDRGERPMRDDQSGRPVRGPAHARPQSSESRFAPRGAPDRGDRPMRDEQPGRPVRGPASARPQSGDSRFAPRGAPNRADRPVREEPVRQFRSGRGSPPQTGDRGEARFTPRVTPGRAPERPAREENVAKPARAARARAHRDTQDPRPPRAGAIVDRPTKGPAGGRGKPSRPSKPGNKPGRPPRTRK